MADQKTKKAFVVSDFKDAGTERKFAASTQGKPETFADVDEGSFINYAAAGLVREPTAEDKKAASAA